ncbi:elongation factor 1-gamma [Auriculariales sp. MPI-PUGE-AT-0066]|nr:elongation factor 1-gamma [Auriculariales sp. MPI-PUGE-AT-0066]
MLSLNFLFRRAYPSSQTLSLPSIDPLPVLKMAPIGTLYIANDGQAPGRVIRAVGAITGTEFTSPSSYTHYETNKTPEFLAKFPYGKVPALELASGGTITEGIAIARYVANKAGNKQLLGTTPEERALVDQWQNFTYTELAPPFGRLRGLYNHTIPYNKPLETALKQSADRSLEYLNHHLTSHTFLATERLSIADLAAASVLFNLFGTYLDTAARTKWPNLQRYFETVINQQKVKEFYAEPVYTEKAAAYVAPVKEEKKKEDKPKAAAAPKAEKPKKAAEADDDDDEPSVPAEPKVKNPLDDLPKSTFNLEDWKRAYSNKETRGADGALEWFYQNYDPAGYSIWRVDFKYNQELTQVFMSSNQIGGFFNRLEGSRKYLFGSMGVLGSAGDSVLSGALILRGPEVKPVVEVAPDWESYEYKELKVTGPDANEEDKKFFEAALAWDLEINGKKWADGKNFK